MNTAVLPGEKIAVFANNDSAYRAALSLRKAGRQDRRDHRRAQRNFSRGAQHGRPGRSRNPDRPGSRRHRRRQGADRHQGPGLRRSEWRAQRRRALHRGRLPRGLRRLVAGHPSGEPGRRQGRMGRPAAGLPAAETDAEAGSAPAPSTANSRRAEALAEGLAAGSSAAGGIGEETAVPEVAGRRTRHRRLRRSSRFPPRARPSSISSTTSPPRTSASPIAKGSSRSSI